MSANMNIPGTEVTMEDRLKLSDLAPIIKEIDIAPHGIIAAARKLSGWGLSKSQTLELLYLAARLVEEKSGDAMDLESLVDELHRLEECAICGLAQASAELRDIMDDEDAADSQ